MAPTIIVISFILTIIKYIKMSTLTLLVKSVVKSVEMLTLIPRLEYGQIPSTLIIEN